MTTVLNITTAVQKGEGFSKKAPKATSLFDIVSIFQTIKIKRCFEDKYCSMFVTENFTVTCKTIFRAI